MGSAIFIDMLAGNASGGGGGELVTIAFTAQVGRAILLLHPLTVVVEPKAPPELVDDDRLAKELEDFLGEDLARWQEAVKELDR